MSKNAVTPADDLEVIETEEEVETTEEETFSAKDLAAELGTDAKSFRRWLRGYTPTRAADLGGRWSFTADRKAELIAAYNKEAEEPEGDEEVSDEA